MNEVKFKDTKDSKGTSKRVISICLIALVFLSPVSMFARNTNGEVHNFNQAKKFLDKNLDLFENKTIYCSCRTYGKRKIDIESCGYKIQKKNSEKAFKMEWEHVVPAEAFGHSFIDWREGVEHCVSHKKRFKGRKCAEKNPEFAKMESDLYNLFPEIAELNRLRSNYSMATLSSSERDFGGCKVKLADRKFEPQDLSKGIVARTYLNFENRYPGRGIVSDKNKKLFEAWDKEHPVTDLECRRWKKLEKKNGYTHLFANRCSKLD